MLVFSLKSTKNLFVAVHLVLWLLGEVVGKAKRKGPLIKPVGYQVFLCKILPEQDGKAIALKCQHTLLRIA